MVSLATVAMVAARVGEPITDPEDVALAESVLAEASELVRFHGGQAWPDPATAPAMAVTITVAAAARAYQNPAGFDMERGDMVTFNRGKDYSTGAALTQGEITIIKAVGRGGNVRSMRMSNPNIPIPRSTKGCGEYRGYVPVDWGGNKPFPLGGW